MKYTLIFCLSALLLLSCRAVLAHAPLARPEAPFNKPTGRWLFQSLQERAEAGAPSNEIAFAKRLGQSMYKKAEFFFGEDGSYERKALSLLEEVFVRRGTWAMSGRELIATETHEGSTPLEKPNELRFVYEGVSGNTLTLVAPYQYSGSAKIAIVLTFTRIGGSSASTASPAKQLGGLKYNAPAKWKFDEDLSNGLMEHVLTSPDQNAFITIHILRGKNEADLESQVNAFVRKEAKQLPQEEFWHPFLSDIDRHGLVMERMSHITPKDEDHQSLAIQLYKVELAPKTVAVIAALEYFEGKRKYQETIRQFVDSLHK